MAPVVRRVLKDALLWALLAVPAVGADRIGLNEPRAPWQELAGLAVLALAVALHRARPLLAFLAVAALGLVASPALFTVSYGPALAVFALLLGARSGGGRPVLVSFAGIAVAGTVRILVRDVDPAPEWLVLLATLLFAGCFPWLVGRYWRQRAALVSSALARAEQLEREQLIVADRARLRERARIAQDMHDSLGHELSLLALRAGALQLDPGLDERHRAAAAELRGAAADATDRLREIIGLLREEGDESAPLVPAGETVEALVERAGTSGLDVRLHTEGKLGGARRDVLCERIVHRVVQEALTNAVKYAPGAAVRVDLVRDAAGATVTVTDEGAPDAPRGEGGTGLIGLRERVLDEGGNFHAGPYGEGFRVHAWLPAERLPRLDAPHPQAQVLVGLRRRTLLSFAAAGAAGVLLVAGTFAWYAYSKTHSVLRPADYARLDTGMSEADVRKVLPERDVADPPDDRAPEPPAGADCHYYRASGQLFVSVEHFRLCFEDGRLVAKDAVPAAGKDRE
ncbi:ATP-binding protein [Streptomyces sp. TRM66268-LWL]|uniref:histidine kinase n=1 Tax=Streptomyces polyasparticus TaxID=2767826 RepID=A0ABR7SRE9_9ACTN|nr:ATP-binding protein [Streptomyces polyasparticus]